MGIVMDTKSLRDYTIEDAINEYEQGFAIICEDGKVKCVIEE